MARCPFAEWRGPIPNKTPGGMGTVQGVVFHIMGSNFSAADGWFHNPDAKASAHFGIKQDGGLVQWVDTADKAWHAAAANSHWIGVETEGASGPLSDAGIKTFGRLYAWLHEQFGVPFQITDDPNGGHGLGWHGMGGSAWGGHDYCPGPERRAQRQRVVDLAHGQQGGPELDDAERKLLQEAHDNAIQANQKAQVLQDILAKAGTSSSNLSQRFDALDRVLSLVQDILAKEGVTSANLSKPLATLQAEVDAIKTKVGA